MFSYLDSYVVPLAEITSDHLFFFRFGCVFVICANGLLILNIDLIYYQNSIAVFEVFVQRWCLLKNFDVFLVTKYVKVVMVAARMSVVRS